MCEIVEHQAQTCPIFCPDVLACCCLLLLPSRFKVIQQAVASRRVSSNDALDVATDKSESACLAQLARAVFKDKLVLAGVKLR